MKDSAFHANEWGPGNVIWWGGQALVRPVSGAGVIRVWALEALQGVVGGGGGGGGGRGVRRADPYCCGI